MCKCVQCDITFELEDGHNPFYCSERCAIIKNQASDKALTDDPYLHLREIHKANTPKPRRVSTPEGINRKPLLCKAW